MVVAHKQAAFSTMPARYGTAAFLKELQTQTEKEKNRGRAAIITGDGPLVWEPTPKGLGKALKKIEHDTRHTNDSSLLILEDLGASWIEEIRGVLDIPAYVLALHWMHPDDHILGTAKVPLGQDPERHFILNYRQPLPFRVTRRESDEPIQLNCTAQRTIVRRIRSLKGLEIEDVDTTEQLVSYWRTRCGKHPIAVLLVDPCPDLKAQFPQGAFNVADPSDPHPHPILSHMRFNSDISSSEISPEKKGGGLEPLSLFDELVHSYEVGNYVTSHPITEPLQWTSQCRRLVLAKTASVVQSALVETWKLTYKASTGVKQMANFDFAELERKAWSDDWKGEFFTQLWELREDLELMRYRLETNQRDLHRIANIERSSKGLTERDELVARKQLDLDMQEWERLGEMNDYAFKLMNRTTETYVQAIGATSAQFANAQAQNSRKLTGFAAVFVPASLCAAILAIPSFSPDEKSPVKFWVFWAVSVPIAIILGLWFLSPIPAWTKKKWNGRRSSYAPEAIREKALAAPSGAALFGDERV